MCLYEYDEEKQREFDREEAVSYTHLLCPATVRAQTVSEEFSVKVAEAAETEAVEGTADPTEEPVVTGNEDTAKTDTPQAAEVPEQAEVVGTGKDEKTSVPETAEEKTEASGDSWEEDEELKLYGTADQDVDENGPVSYTHLDVYKRQQKIRIW